MYARIKIDRMKGITFAKHINAPVGMIVFDVLYDLPLASPNKLT